MNKENLKTALKIIGVKKGDKLLVHASFKSLKFEGTPEDVCRAFMETVTETGLLMVVTHSYNFISKPGVDRVYDRTKSKSQVGAFSDAFWRIKGVERSFHPSHSVAAFGRNTREYLKDHHKGETMGRTGPLYRFAKAGGRILMLGCNLNSCTMIHTAEFLADVPYLKIHYDTSWGYGADYIDENGKQARYHYNTIPGCSHKFERCAPMLIADKAAEMVSLGTEESYLIKANKMMKLTEGALAKDPYYFLDEKKKLCYHCSEAFRQRARTAG
jgi:aminoglycoside 3-N-acetyltransferase